jgi:hypothetical protein
MTVLSVVFCGCGTWSLILGLAQRLKICDNRLLRRIFEPKGEEVTEDWRKWHNEEFHNLYSLSNGIMKN